MSAGLSRRRVGRRVALALVPAALVFSLMTAAALPATADPEGPSKEEVEKSEEKVEKREEALDEIRTKLDDARERLGELSMAAQQAADEYHREQAELEQARDKRQQAQERLQRARREVNATEEEIGTLAAEAYRGRGGLRQLAMVLEADGLRDLLDRLATVRRLSRERSAMLDELRADRVTARVLEYRARQALAKQREATREVQEASEAAEETLAEQQAEVDRIQSLESERKDKLEDARERAKRLEREREQYLEALRKAREARAAEKRQDGSGGGGGSCADKPVSLGSYSNGLIPESALCPLPQDGHMLRADAAAAFKRLNTAYAGAFGEPICVTDSYRDLATQQYLYETKPNLAAVPGTSNHGLGIAVDLCGGIQDYGTSQHEWMRDHAPGHGWNLPEWARASGSKPEPWHWEYVG